MRVLAREPSEGLTAGWAFPTRLAVAVWCLVMGSATAGGQFQKDRPCDQTVSLNNQTFSMQYQVPGTAPPRVISFPFRFGTSQTFSGWLQQLSFGYYPYADITSTGGAAVLSNAKVSASCYYTGMATGTDTTWLPQKSLGTPTGDVRLLYNGDEDQLYCDGVPVDDASQCTGETGGGGGGTGGGNSGGNEVLVVCRWTDYYDDNWNYLYSVDRGCTTM